MDAAVRRGWHGASHAQNALGRILRSARSRAIQGITSCDLTLWNGSTEEIEDPYRFPPLISDFDLHIHGEGTQYESYRTMGAHLVECQGVAGVRFAVWAPNAEVVSVVGDFNDWDERRHPMRRRTGGSLGDLPARSGRGRELQIFRPCALARLSPAKGRSLRIRHGGSAEIRLRRVRSARLISGTTSSGWKRAPTKTI